MAFGSKEFDIKMREPRHLMVTIMDHHHYGVRRECLIIMARINFSHSPTFLLFSTETPINDFGLTFSKRLLLILCIRIPIN